MHQKFNLEAFASQGAICSIDAKTVILGWGKKTTSTKPLEFPCWYATDFFLEAKAPYFSFEQWMKVDAQEFSHQLLTKQLDPIDWDPIDWNSFEKAFSVFETTSLKKVVPYVHKAGRYQMDASALMTHLKAALNYLSKNPKTILYGSWGEGRGVLGVTPEVLLQLEPHQPLQTVACAGTLTVENEPLWREDHKLIKEHQLVIDGIAQSLEPYGKVNIGETGSRRFSKLIHLVTPIELHPHEPLCFDTMIQKLHPTPALGGYPKDESHPWLEAYAKQLPRGEFGAPFGLLTEKGKGSAYVAIRNMVWEPHQIVLRAGCGIVKESSLADEKKEIENKLCAIKEILGL